MNTPTDTIRNATLSDLAELLKDQDARKIDMVVPAAKLQARNGQLVVAGAEAQLDDDGVTQVDGIYTPTAVCDEGVADKLGVPVAYLKRLRQERPDLYDANVNGWLHGSPDKVVDDAENPGMVRFVPGSGDDPRKFMLRAFRGAEGTTGVARSLLSDTYKRMDHFDVLTAALSGIRDSGTEVVVDSCDLSERRMQVRIAAPAIAALAPVLLANYRSPWGGELRPVGQEPDAREAQWRAHAGYERGEEPVVFAGFVLSNSETGGGAFTITPRFVVKVCKNGLTITEDVLRNVHLGGRLEEGVVRWSEGTERKNLELVASRTRDAVATFLDIDYMTAALAKIEAKAGVRVTDAVATIQNIGKALRFSEAETKSVLDHFVMGGQGTAGGVLNAVTSAAQTLTDADAAADLEAQGIKAMELAAASA
ncbi:MAG: hypothetical protein SHS37scaffold145_42 [Phage 71_18]|nr:MAG: hypothetical protein SHS37scaffold145_42 [Phage 71_18]